MQRTEDKKRAESFKPGQRLPASWVQKVENFISSFKVLSGGQFIWDGRTAALQIYSGEGTWAFSLKSINSSTQTLIMREGLVNLQTSRLYVPETEINLTGSPAFVVLKIKLSDEPEAEWLLSTVSSVPASTPEYHYEPFLEFRIPEGGTNHNLYLVHNKGSFTIW